MVGTGVAKPSWECVRNVHVVNQVCFLPITKQTASAQQVGFTTELFRGVAAVQGEARPGHSEP